MTQIQIPRSNGGTSFVELCGHVFPWVIDKDGNTVKYLIHFDEKIKIVPVTHLDETNNGMFHSGEYPQELEDYFQKEYGKPANALAKYLDDLDEEYNRALMDTYPGDPTPGNIMRIANKKTEIYQNNPLLFYSILK